MLRIAPRRWQFEMLSYERCLVAVRESIRVLTATGRRDKKIVLTTSPAPIGRSLSGDDALVANTYGKSVLRAVCGAVREEYSNVDYFPSYESVALTKGVDVWRDDVLHDVHPHFVAKIVEHFVRCFVDGALGAQAAAAADQAERVERCKQRVLSLRECRTNAIDATIVDKPRGMVLVATGPQCTVEYGPVDASGCRLFSAGIAKRAGMPAANVELEVRDSDSGGVCFRSSCAIGDQTHPWRLRLPALPASAIVTLRFQVLGPYGAEPRFAISAPRLVGESPRQAMNGPLTS
jgi:hypothetical protein